MIGIKSSCFALNKLMSACSERSGCTTPNFLTSLEVSGFCDGGLFWYYNEIISKIHPKDIISTENGKLLFQGWLRVMAMQFTSFIVPSNSIIKFPSLQWYHRALLLCFHPAPSSVLFLLKSACYEPACS